MAEVKPADDLRAQAVELQKQARSGDISNTEAIFDKLRPVLQGLDDAARVTANGMLWGWADELAARAEEATGGPAYEQGSLLEEAKTAQARARLGTVPSMALDIGGAMLTGGPALGAAATAGRQLPAVARYALPGAVEGAIAGAGYAGPGERAQGAAIGGAVGGAIGGAIPIVRPIVEAAGRGVRGLSNRIRDPGGERTAAQRVRSAAQRDELTGQEALARLQRGGEDVTLMDVGGPNLQGLGANLARTPGSAQKRMRTTLSTRQSKQGRRVLDALKKGLRVKNREYSDEVESIIGRRADEADQLYGDARDEMVLLQQTDVPVFESDRVKWLVDNSKDLQRAVKRAQRLPEFRGYSPYSWDLVDRAYKYLGDTTRRAKQAGRSAQARDLVRLRDQFREAILEENPAYAKALDAYAGDSALLDALEEGRKFSRNEGEVTRKMLSDMSDIEREMFRVGVVKEARKLIQGGGTAWETNAVRRIFKNPEQVKTLEPAFGSRKDFLQFTRELIPLERQYQTYKNVFTGSPTAPRLSEEASAGMTDAAKQWMRGNREGALEMGVKWAKNAIAPDTDEIRKATAKLLAPRTPEELQRSIEVISGVKSGKAKKQLLAAIRRQASQTIGTAEAALPIEGAIVAEDYLGGS